MFFEALRLNLPDRPLEKLKGRPFFKMAAILHLEVGVCPKEIINSAYLNDLGVL